MSVLPLLEAAAETGNGITFVSSGSSVSHSYRELLDGAAVAASGMQALGLGEGPVCGVLAPTSRFTVETILGLWLLGVAPTVLPPPTRSDTRGTFADTVRRRLTAAGARFLVTTPKFGWLESADSVSQRVIVREEWSKKRLAPFDAVKRAGDRYETVRIVQATSGTTGQPRMVTVLDSALGFNIQAMAKGMNLDPSVDTFVGWLPLYHDMGLVGLLGIPLTSGARLVITDPTMFASAPDSWMQLMASHRGTITMAPDFAYAVATRFLHKSPAMDLSAYRLALNGAETINPTSFGRFVSVARRYGMSKSAAFCAYGLAEAVLGVTFPGPGVGMRVDTVDREVLQREHLAVPVTTGSRFPKSMALVGRALPGLQVRVIGARGGGALMDRMVGEIEVRGPCVTSSYDLASASRSASGDWLQTGDLGYMTAGQLIVCGRAKDTIVVGGRSIAAEEFEWACASVPGVRKGAVAAFSVEGPARERVIIVAEAASAGRAEIRRQLVDAAARETGIIAYDVVLLDRGLLPRTTSGKLQRALYRRMYEGTGFSSGEKEFKHD